MDAINSFHRDDNFTAFVQKRVDYYLSRWAVFANSGEKISWNWSAFFFSVYWMMYRKMYIPAVVVFVGSRVVKYVIALRGGHAYGLTTLVVAIGLGLFGNWVYYQYASRKIADVADTAGTDDPSLIGHTIEDVGGTSWLWVFVTMIVGGIVDRVLIAALSGRAASLNNFDADTIWDIL
jgi:Protein of unknown function (DUF2628)